MPTLTTSNGLQFFYTDNGAPKSNVYPTLVIFHGHTFHSGTFKKLQAPATAHSLRLIAVNRREYPGTTPFTPEELKVFREGSDSERAILLAEQGVNLALFIDGLIKELSLPEGGGITLAGWSLGNTFLLALLASIESVPAQTKQRLQAYIKKIIVWDPPSQSLGIASPPGSYLPLWDESIPPEARGAAFGKWAASHFVHGDLSTRDFSKLNYHPDPSKKATFEDVPLGEILTMADFAPGEKYETIVCEPTYIPVLSAQTDKALFDPAIRAAWSGAKVWHLLGEANSWNVHLAAWTLEEKAKALKGTPSEIHFKLWKGVNHFPFWERPEEALETLEEIVRS